MTTTTWDGLPVSNTDPRGASVIVYREGQSRMELLVLHRAHRGPDFEGDWAWTPPSGARKPGEDIDLVAQRELAEETGLQGEPERKPCGNEHWFVYQYQHISSDPIIVDQEHDRYEWVSIREAMRRCRSDGVSAQIEAFASAHEQCENAKAIG